MNSRRVHSWVWLLLPLLVARAVVPVGFMARAQDGQLQMVFCSSGISQPDADHDAAGKQHTDAQNDFSCPFAQVAAAPLPDLGGSVAIPFIPAADILPPAESPYYAAGPPRFIATRGPPGLS